MVNKLPVWVGFLDIVDSKARSEVVRALVEASHSLKDPFEVFGWIRGNYPSTVSRKGVWQTYVSIYLNDNPRQQRWVKVTGKFESGIYQPLKVVAYFPNASVAFVYDCKTRKMEKEAEAERFLELY